MSRPTFNSIKPVFARTGKAVSAGSAALVLAGLTGCGTIPDAQVSYYPAKTSISIKVTRSIACDAKNGVLVANTVTPSVTHSADRTKPKSIRLAGLRGTFSDADAKFDLYDDGRLKSVNATTTGQGEAILKAATTLATTLTAFAKDVPPPAYPAECAFVKDVGGGKPLTLTYEGQVDAGKMELQNIPADASSIAYADRLKGALPGICAVVTETIAVSQPVQYTAKDGDVLIEARQPAMVGIAVGTPTPGNGCTATLWKGFVPVAQLGTDYLLPVPRAVAFGKETLAASFAESGALTSVQYASSAGAAGALGGANSLVTISQGETTSAKVAEVKNQADLIAQQQRLLQCIADPKSCK